MKTGLENKRPFFLLFGLLLVVYFVVCILMSAFVPYDECKSDVPSGEGMWKRDPSGECYYIHSNQEFDNYHNCESCHGVEQDVVFDFVPDIRIRIPEGNMVSVLLVNGGECTLWGGEIVPCSTVVKPPVLGLPVPVFAMGK